MSPHIAIVGAGLIGRILALECRLAGMKVSLFDRDTVEGKYSCAYTGAGMLAPYTELEQTEPIIAALGVESLLLWPQLLEQLPRPVFFQKIGTLVLAHRQDQSELSRFERSLKFKLESPEWHQFTSSGVGARLAEPYIPPNSPDNPAFSPLYSTCARKQLLDLEPDLPTMFTAGIYLPEEGQIDNRQLLDALKIALQNAGVDWQSETEIVLSDICQRPEFDFVVDCRGLGSRPDLQQLRGVRGELIVVEAKGVKLNRPIRLMHPRHPIYIVPRENHQFLIGATSIESDDMRPLTVQSALELLSAACTIHPGFAEGAIIESRVNCRPALPNNLPTIILEAKEGISRLVRVNGLYRHGFLLSPKLAKLTLAYIINGEIDENYRQVFSRGGLYPPLQYKGETTLAISH